MSLEIKQITFSELSENINFNTLIEEYEEEAAIKKLPPIKLKVETYRHYENAGAIYIIGAFFGEKLIGFATVLSPVMPHFSVLISVVESLFVAKEYRKTGAGLKLIEASEKHANEKGSPGLLISAPSGGSLAEVLPHVGYEETNRVFFRKFYNE